MHMALPNSVEASPFRRTFTAVAAAICLVPFAPLLAPNDSVVSGNQRAYAVMHLPLAHFACEELLAGRMPLWNPYLACGQPLLGTQQAMLFYPLTTPLCLLLGANCGLKLAVLMHLAIGFAGTYLLARRVDISSYGAAYAALAVTWGGARLGQLVSGHLGAVFAAALAPWFFLALGSLLRSPGALSAVGLAVAGSLCCLVSQPQVFYYTLVAGALWSGHSLLSSQTVSQRVRITCWGGAAALLAMLLAAVQLSPAIELMRDGIAGSERGTRRFAGYLALEGADAARLLMPYLNGTPFAGVAQFDASDQYQERVIYLGLTAPLLAVYGLSRAGASGWQWGAGWGLVLSLAAAFGDNTPAFGPLGKLLPGLFLFRCPGRVFLVASLALALLAARGLDALARGEPRADARSLSLLALLVMLGVDIPAYAALQAAPAFEFRRYLPYAGQFLLGELSVWALLTLDTALVCALAVVGRVRGITVFLAFAVVTAFDLGHFNVGNFYMGAPDVHRLPQLPMADGLTRFIGESGFERAGHATLRYSRLTRDAIFEHRPTVCTYDGGVLPAATERLYQSMNDNASPALAIAACRFACSSDGRAVEHPIGALPRVRFVADAAPAADAPVEAIVDTDIRGLSQHATQVALCEDLPGELRIEANAATDGWLVVADTFYPGWVCRVDGDVRPIEPAHGVFRRVRFQAGRHTVVMTFRPLSFRIGLIVTCAGAVVATTLVFAHVTSRRRNAIVVCGPGNGSPERG